MSFLEVLEVVFCFMFSFLGLFYASLWLGFLVLCLVLLWCGLVFFFVIPGGYGVVGDFSHFGVRLLGFDGGVKLFVEGDGIS